MTGAGDTGHEAGLVAWQVGRVPRAPWRVASRCAFAYPSTIASPSTLADGTPFPTTYWLTCPWLIERVSALESAGGVGAWARRARGDADVADGLREADRALREARAAESGGVDGCAGVGLAGQRDPLGVKCLHAHVALALVGIDDPVGRGVLSETGETCDDERCARYDHPEDR